MYLRNPIRLCSHQSHISLTSVCTPRSATHREEQGRRDRERGPRENNARKRSRPPWTARTLHSTAAAVAAAAARWGGMTTVEEFRAVRTEEVRRSEHQPPTTATATTTITVAPCCCRSCGRPPWWSAPLEPAAGPAAASGADHQVAATSARSRHGPRGHTSRCLLAQLDCTACWRSAAWSASPG